MAAPAANRFNFDLDLGRRADRSRMLSDSAVDALVAEARRAGRTEGLADAERQLAQTTTGRLAAAVDTLVTAAARMDAALTSARQETLCEAVALSTVIARKLADALVAQQPAAELESLIAECLSSLDDAPHLVIRCHADAADEVRTLTEQRIKTVGFTGRLVVIGDPEMALGDGKIEWADGGLVRDLAAVTTEIEAAIERYLQSRGQRRGGETAE